MKAPNWSRAIVVCVASGPSLLKEDVELVRMRHAAGACRVIAINREFETAPWADVLYASDYHFWREYIDDIRALFKGAAWTIDARAAHQFKLGLLKRGMGEGLATAADTINTGGNSGYQAAHLAASWGASRIVLLGYDMQSTDGKEHHYGKHRARLPNGRGFKSWIPRFAPLMRDLTGKGVSVINATRETAIPESLIPRASLHDQLEIAV